MNMNMPLRSDIVIGEPLPAPSRPPLSDLHAMLGKIERRFDAARLNAIANHPSIYPLVKGFDDKPIDLSAVVANPDNILLIGEHGAMLFNAMQPGLYEAHLQVLPEGYGPWSRAFAAAAIHWLFTRSDAVEIWARVPHAAGRRLAEDIGAGYELTNPRGWIADSAFVPAEVYRLTIQDWLGNAPGLAERGQWFREKLSAEWLRHVRREPPRPDAGGYDQYLGATVEMLMGDMPDKAVIFHNRWAAMSGYPPIAVTSYRPITVDLGDALIVVRTDDFWVALIRPGAN